MSVKIPLSQGLVALVDDGDVAQVLAVGAWHAADCGVKTYARHWYRDQFDVPHTIAMHTLLTGWTLVDHVNGDGLDNRRANLRPATASQNAGNSRRPSHNTSGFKGVRFYKRTGRWQAHLSADGRQQHLGYFSTAEEAARVYDTAALARWGEYAFLNFPAT